MLLDCVYLEILSAESQMAVNAVHQCSIEKQRGAIAIDSNSPLQVLNGTLLYRDNALLALN